MQTLEERSATPAPPSAAAGPHGSGTQGERGSRRSDSTTPVLDVQSLTIALPAGADREFAVREVSFTLHAGRTLCLVGESGSGKSVIAQTLMGLAPSALRPVGGSISLLGESRLTMTPKRLRELRGTRMAMVFQEPMTALNPVMRCGEQLDELLREHTTLGKRERYERIIAMLTRVRLPDPPAVYSAYPHQLSGGQRQRIVIALAVLLQPELLICDEPTTALDVTTQAEILKLISELREEFGTAVLFITHDFGVVSEIADEVLVLELGEMIEKGDKFAVLQRPQHAYTRMLLAAVPTVEGQARPPVKDGYPLLEAANICKTYVSKRWPRPTRTVHAADNISFRLHPGETIGIVGESGSGKSTLARCVARLLVPTSGDIFADGLSVAQKQGRALKPFRQAVQVIFQDPYRSLDPRQTVGESIIEGPTNFGVSRKDAWERAKGLMTLVRLQPDALHRYPNEFSGGQRQRLCIARALACEPKVLIADEAVSALDVSVQKQILELLTDIQQRLGIGILFITHDLRVARQISDRIIVMQRGKVVEQGSCESVFSNPQETYTQTLLSSAPGHGFSFYRPSSVQTEI